MLMRDWSSDVCSSDLHRPILRPLRRPVSARPFLPRPLNDHMRGPDSVSRCRQFQRNVRLAFRVDGVDCRLQRGECVQLVHVAQGGGERSEEHTSELQSLMRISYAVFCLKKKKPINHKTKA